eukprot:CAMPEP_0174253230 /NCGR_PEP_ID=MMETSP0439-20130205/2606_1 /TAXON_ID=0 /ORGANISM="Stereomyxa ramosa, Strain Chinc5" /LENGTH=525 /DNA_ID=CAMNT_0015334145 /DNA_START=19 /DNA_END=1596 /DNA_ORIENTATION=-
MKVLGALLLFSVAIFAKKEAPTQDYLSGVIKITDATTIKVNTTTQLFEDSEGRVRVFHGVNVVYKIFPWHPSNHSFDPNNSLAPIDIKRLAEWGFNVVRLGVMWPGVEPLRGQFNVTYLSVIRDIISHLASYGIYTIVDFHQDVYSRQFCGEGFPDWATLTDDDTKPFAEPIAPELPVDPSNNYPNLTDCLDRDFTLYYFSSKVSNAFQNLYDNKYSLQDSFVGYWREVVKSMKETTGILGYELINEPWAGDIYKDPLLLVPGYADSKNLAPLYHNLQKAIRDIDDQRIIFFEDATTDVPWKTGFTPETTPGGVEYDDRQALSYHIYCGPSDSGGNPTNLFLCDAELLYFYDQAMAALKTLGTGGFMTEFGGVGNATVGAKMLKFLTDLADKYLQSWTYWQFKFYHDLTTDTGSGESFYDENGKLQKEKVKMLSRSYAQAIAGVPLSQSFDTDTSLYRLSFSLDPSISAPTVVYINEQYYYPNGFSVTTQPPGSLSYSQPATNFLYFVSSGNSAVLNVTITISPL